MNLQLGSGKECIRKSIYLGLVGSLGPLAGGLMGGKAGMAASALGK